MISAWVPWIGRIDRHALGLRAHVRQGRLHLGELAAAAEERLGVAVRAREATRALEIFGERLECREIFFEILMRLGGRRAELSAERVHPHTVEDAEIDHLRAPSHLGVDRLGRDVEHLRRDFPVHVAPAPEYRAELLVAREDRRETQLHLRVVERQEREPLRRDESVAYRPSSLGVDGDVLQVRILARHAAGVVPVCRNSAWRRRCSSSSGGRFSI